jgi:hypothetical protein
MGWSDGYVKTNPRSEGTPPILRASDLDPAPPYAVFLQNTPLLSDAVPRVGTLGWYALPRWGKLAKLQAHPQGEC